MSLALYRRYRPETFAEVIGQEHVTDPLQQALRNNRVNHAYLFSGPRGCGKTTSARILARCLNCEKGPTPTPCGECRSCLDLARNGPGSIDVIEIDAASHGGVDDARDLREKAFFGPAGSRYKIYIIDEAHMVTSAGFNALLKVVEEPPEHLKFIFATTEPEKVIGTIRSRTHHYPFRLVPPGTLRDHLSEVCGREGIQVEDGVYPLVVRAGAGSVRDSMSVMDQLLAGAAADGVTYAMATALLGYTDATLLDDVVDGFAAGDGAAVFSIVDRVVEGGHDPRRFVADLLERLRDLVILAAVPDAAEKGLIDAPRDVLDRMQAQASVFGSAELSRAADLVNTGLTEMRGATSPRLQLELICARVLLPAAYEDERSLQARLERLERGVASGAAAAGGGFPAAPGPAQGGSPGGPAAARAAMGRPAPEPGQPQTPVQAPAPAPVQAPPQAPPVAEPAAPPPAAAHQPPPAQPTQTPHPAQAQAPAGEPQASRPGAWPVTSGAAPGGGGPAGPAAPRPGAWPTAATPGVQQDAARPAPAAPQTAQGQQAPPPQQAPAPPAQPQVAAPVGDPSRVRQLWPQILEAVKHRRLTWMLLLNNARIVGFDGETLQIGFDNPGARNSFANGDSEDVLKQAISTVAGASWRIETLVDPGGGGGGGGGGQSGYGGHGGGGGAPRPPAPQQPSGAHAPYDRGGADSPSAGQGPGSSGNPGSGPGAGAAADGSPGSGPTGHGGGAATALAARPGTGAPPAPRPAEPHAAQGRAPMAPAEEPPPLEDDIPEDDDPDLVDSALSGHDLFIRELGATVIEEISHG
ncbi:DNA polymerase III subunit gamma and tau [Streptomyces sp. NPDC020917]|uniref:DNA polymerase III subunit gamma and tau n=1 Tax=Streptomyces sp. NPDC020917 TaxID=3365102 RepID=UPI003791EB5B